MRVEILSAHAEMLDAIFAIVPVASLAPCQCRAAEELWKDLLSFQYVDVQKRFRRTLGVGIS